MLFGNSQIQNDGCPSEYPICEIWLTLVHVLWRFQISFLHGFDFRKLGAWVPKMFWPKALREMLCKIIANRSRPSWAQEIQLPLAVSVSYFGGRGFAMQCASLRWLMGVRWARQGMLVRHESKKCFGTHDSMAACPARDVTRFSFLIDSEQGFLRGRMCQGSCWQLLSLATRQVGKRNPAGFVSFCPPMFVPACGPRGLFSIWGFVPTSQSMLDAHGRGLQSSILRGFALLARC